MSTLVTIVEAVLRNSAGGELDRVRLEEREGYYRICSGAFDALEPGDTITVEARQEEREEHSGMLLRRQAG